MAVQRETELYPPIKQFFVERGYEVKAEVRGCDLVACRADRSETAIVEMKRIFTLPLLLQGVERQRTGAAVWLAVERNRVKKGAHNQRYGELTALCRRLGLGFMTVTFYKTKPPAIDVWCPPAAPDPAPAAPYAAGAEAGLSGSAAEAPAVYTAAQPARKRVKAGEARLLKEFAGRSGDYNVGGSTKRKLMTAYREKALQCALALSCHGTSSPARVREWTGCANAGALLRSNYYGWYVRVAKGAYAISPAGTAALAQYAEVAAVWIERFPWASGRKQDATTT